MSWETITKNRLNNLDQIKIKEQKMSVIVKQPENSGNFEQLQPGTYRAICKGVFDIGIQKQEYNGEVKYPDQIIMIFEVDARIQNGEYANERYNMSKWYTKSLHEKAALRHHLEAWRGKPFSETELMGFDLDRVIGATCTLTISLNQNGKAKIMGIGKDMPNMPPLALEKPYNGEIPEWIRDIQARAIKPNDPYQAKHNQQNICAVFGDMEDIPF